MWTVKYSKTYTQGNYTRTWTNQVYYAYSEQEAENIVNQWNQNEKLGRLPDSGQWTYTLESISGG